MTKFKGPLAARGLAGGEVLTNRCTASVHSGVKGSGEAGQSFRVYHKGWGFAGSGSQ